jgi:hypothetical protein
MSRTNTIDSLFFVQLIVGAFFLILGLEAITFGNSAAGQVTNFFNNLSGNSKGIVDVVIAVVEIVSGAFIILALILPFKKPVFNFATFVIFALWAIRIVYVYFVSVKVFTPSTLTWLRGISLDGLVLVSVWVINKRFSST